MAMDIRRAGTTDARGSAHMMLPAAGMSIAVMVLVVMAVASMIGGGLPNGWNMPAMPGGMGRGTNGHMGMMNRGGTDTSSATPSIGDISERVAIRDFAFTPGNLQIPAGATITWTNSDSAPHDASSRDGTWRTRLLSQGESDSITFAEAGDYEYYCSVHPNMVARLTVR